MLTIRRNVFETNSSSMHSLAYSKKDHGYDYNLPVDENGILRIPFGEYGWGPDILKTPIEKLSYLITDRGGLDDEIVDMIKEYCPKVKEIELETIGSYYPEGYVDHESYGTSSEASPEELIFNNNIIIVIDNDNSPYFSNYDYSDCDFIIDPEVIEELFGDKETIINKITEERKKSQKSI